ncbi:hypothetical protein [Nioella aestuarii]|uniref:hypothetical protein n=1 Tax=Nioella aestuarii TaxID=1662864 RepID=UPI003D7F6FB9
MTNKIRARYLGPATVGLGVMGASIYLLMVNITLAHLEAISGLIPFDMRPLGYSHAEALTLLGALGADGRAYYLSHQIPLDTVYPALLALTLMGAICWIGQRLPNRTLVRAGVALSLGAAAFDYAENLAICVMIWNGPTPSVPLVFAASAATIAKSVLTSLAVSLTLLLGAMWARQSMAERRVLRGGGRRVRRVIE